MDGDGAHPGPEGNVLYRRIVRAAEELFKKAGFRGVTMESVARDAAVSKATLYGHFKNKDQLFLVVCSRMAQLQRRAFEEALGVPHQPVDERVLQALLAKHRLTHTLVRTSPHAEDLFSHKARLAGDLFARTEAAMLDELARALADDGVLQPSAQQLARALLFGGGEIAARCTSMADLESELTAFVRTHLAGARALTRKPAGRR